MLNKLCRIISAPFFNETNDAMDFDGVKQGLEESSIVLIDVRNPDEVRNLGRIPGSHNLPRKFVAAYCNVYFFEL